MRGLYIQNRMDSVKLIDMSQIHTINKYKNLRCKVLKCKANVYFNKQCLEKYLVTNCAKISNKSRMPKYTQRKIYKLRLREEIKFLHTKKCDISQNYIFILNFKFLYK